MTSGAGLGPTSAVAGGALPGRAADSAAPTDAAHGSSPFEMLFAGLRHEPEAKGRGMAKDGMARPMPGSLGAEARKPGLGGAGEEKAGATQDAGDGPAIATEAATLDAGPQGQNLVQAVVLRIAAALDDTAAKAPDEVAPEAHADAGAKRRGAPVATTLALAVAAARRPDTVAVRADAAPDLSVTRREKHFGPVLAAVTDAPAEWSAGDERPPAVSGGPGTAFERMAASRGRAEQIMMAGRAAPGEGRAAQGPLPGTAAEAAVRAATADARPGGIEQGGANAPESPLLQVGAAPGGASDARLIGPMPTQAAGAQPAAPTVFSGTVGPVKVLHIQLQPVELGALEIRMRLTDAGLEVHIEASRQETATLLKNDREALAHVLRGTGHAVDAVTVSLADKSAAQGQGSQDGGQFQSPGARPDAHAGGPRDQGGGEQRLPSRPGGSAFVDKVRDDQDRPALAARHGDLYL